MRIPRINHPHVVSCALKKVKHVCSEKERAVKNALPGVLLFAESITMPVQTPNTLKFIKTLAVPKPQVVAETFEQPTAEFLNIKGMVQRVVPDVNDEFITQIIETADRVKCSPEDLTALLYKESQFKPEAKSGTFGGIGQMNNKSLALSISHSIKNNTEKDSLKTGLMLERFLSLPREKQMPYVRNYILAMKSAYIKNPQKTLTGGELYGLFYTPGRVNAKFLTSAKDSATRSIYNKYLDFDKDSTVTVHDLQNVLNHIKSTDLNVRLAKNSPRPKE